MCLCLPRLKPWVGGGWIIWLELVYGQKKSPVLRDSLFDLQLLNNKIQQSLMIDHKSKS